MDVCAAGRAGSEDRWAPYCAGQLLSSSLKQSRGPWVHGRSGYRLSGFKNLKPKNVPGMSLQVSAAGKTKELEAKVCEHCSLGVQTASAATVIRRCLPTEQLGGPPVRAPN